jgi:ankyrin repeat protein
LLSYKLFESNSFDDWKNILFNSIKNNNIEGVKISLNNIKNVNDVILNYINETPLMEAVCRGLDDIVRMLLEKGSDPNAKDKQGYTALSYACMIENLNAVKILEKYNADINCITTDGHDNLYLSFFAVPEKNENINTKIEMIKFLIEKGIDINRIDSFQNWDIYHYISKTKGTSELIDIIYEKNKNINHIDNDGMTPLLSSILLNDNKTFKKLFELGADPFIRSNFNDIKSNVFKIAIHMKEKEPYYYNILNKKYPEYMAATEINIF